MDDLVQTLDALIRFPTTNPGGDEPALARFLHQQLAASRPSTLELVTLEGSDRKPRAYVFAFWGIPKRIINVHLDTVPPNTGWLQSPTEPKRCANPKTQQGDGIMGLGACDVKGSLAAVLVALQRMGKPPQNRGVLFSGDEEADGICVPHFLASPWAQDLQQAIVCEPTQCQIGIRHRGYLVMTFTLSACDGGHSSLADHTPSPMAAACTLGAKMRAWALEQAKAQAGHSFAGHCLNIAHIDGGVAPNVIAQNAVLTVSLRPPPHADPATIAELLAQQARSWLPRSIDMSHAIDLIHPPLPGNGAIQDFADLWPSAQGVDLAFWTEAALFAQAKISAVIYGPGHIDAAHAANEWVSLDALQTACDVFGRALDATL